MNRQNDVCAVLKKEKKRQREKEEKKKRKISVRKKNYNKMEPSYVKINGITYFNKSTLI